MIFAGGGSYKVWGTPPHHPSPPHHLPTEVKFSATVSCFLVLFLVVFCFDVLRVRSVYTPIKFYPNFVYFSVYPTMFIPERGCTPYSCNSNGITSPKHLSGICIYKLSDLSNQLSQTALFYELDHASEITLFCIWGNIDYPQTINTWSIFMSSSIYIHLWHTGVRGPYYSPSVLLNNSFRDISFAFRIIK